MSTVSPRPLRPWLVVPTGQLDAADALLGAQIVGALLVMSGTRREAAGIAGATDERTVVVFSLSQAWRIGTVHGDDGAERSPISLLPGWGS